MQLFNISAIFLVALQLLPAAVVGGATGLEARAPTCDKKCAKSLIQRKPHAKSYCSSYLRAHGASTRTVTVTTKAKSNCVTVTATSVTTELDFFIDASVSTTLPVITITEYSSTVVIVTGPTRVIDRRAAVKETKAAPCPCRNLSSCSSNTISAACREIAGPPPTITKTVIKPCTATTTVTSTTLKFTEITSGTQVATPPPDTTTINEVHTTYIPEECARDLYSPPQEIGNARVEILDYPFYARTPIECCTICFARKNCAVAAYGASTEDCYLLIVTERQPGGAAGEMCPLGRQNFTFIRDFDFGVNALPGPCGF
ncbi:hypothetical protein TWF730_006840 [Orbilia blumenaviensis]|uniref:Apple domain-containing protein n=1 Tax=Orbilia blumenaviensis TaxID=1796055 RepID=A0AAV9VIW9_9PEZI